MKVTKIEYLDSSIRSGSGTGHSEPNKFLVTFDNGKTKVVWIDIWYHPKDIIYSDFLDGMGDICCDNINEAFEMYLDIATDGFLCPFSKEEILDASK